MFENLLGSLKERMNDHFEKKKLEKEEMERMQREIDFQRKQTFQEEFKKNALKVAISKAKQDAAKASGIQKLRAKNRLRNLSKSNPNNPGNYLSEFAAYTQKNLAKRDENMKRTAELREVAKKLREERMQKKEVIRPNSLNRKW